jgi:hypothetical protein
VDGELVEMPPESDRNNLISLYLFAEFLKFFPLQLICHKDTEKERIMLLKRRCHETTI